MWAQGIQPVENLDAPAFQEPRTLDLNGPKAALPA
jgi:hypothetical protein